MVSVIIPTFNRPDMLSEAIASVINQSHKDTEIIVVNDGGEDVKNLIEEFQKKGEVIYLQHQRNKGLAAARNTGVQFSRGRYIAYLDDDDIFYPNHIEILTNYLIKKESKVAYTDAYRAHQRKENGKYAIYKRDLPYSFDFDYRRILFENFIPVLCVLHEKSCFDEIDSWDSNLKRTEDWDLWIRLSKRFQFAHIKEITCEFRWRTDGTSMMNSNQEAFAWAALNMFFKYRDFVKDVNVLKAHRNMVAISLKSLINFLHKAIQEKKRNVCEILQCGSLDQMLADSKYLKEMYPEQSNAFDHLIYLLRSLAIEVDDSPVNRRRSRIERSAEEKEIATIPENIPNSANKSSPKSHRFIAFYFRNFIPSLKMTSGGVRDSPNGRMWPKQGRCFRDTINRMFLRIWDSMICVSRK